MVFNRKEYMKKYYEKNKPKLKQYSSNYKKKRQGIIEIPIEVKKGQFLITFN